MPGGVAATVLAGLANKETVSPTGVLIRETRDNWSTLERADIGLAAQTSFYGSAYLDDHTGHL